MNKSTSHRLESFSDGVIAIAITLLALELKVPVLASNDIKDSLLEIVGLLPTLLTFILSFVTIAILWVNHHQMTEHIKTLNRRIIWSNMAFLMFLALIPFATRVIAENPYHSLSVATYGFVLLCGSFSFSFTHLLIHLRVNKNLSLHSKLIENSMVGPIIYVAAIFSAFYYVPIAYILLIIPPLYYFLPKRLKG